MLFNVAEVPGSPRPEAPEAPAREAVAGAAPPANGAAPAPTRKRRKDSRAAVEQHAAEANGVERQVEDVLDEGAQVHEALKVLPATAQSLPWGFACKYGVI